MTSKDTPLKIGDFQKPFSETDLGRGFKLNIANGEDPFKKKVFSAKIETRPFTTSRTVSKVITDVNSLEDSMEIDGCLGVSYGPMISGEGSGKYLQQAVSSSRNITLIYRSRQSAFFKRLQPGTLSVVKEVEDLRAEPNTLSDRFGTKFVETIIYGAQLDVTFHLRATEDINVQEIEAELKGKIGVGPLSIDFQAHFEKKAGEKHSKYNLDINAKATGVFFAVPSNPTFDQVNELITRFNREYEDKFKKFDTEKDLTLLEQIEPIAFQLSSIADAEDTLSKESAAVLDSKMGYLGKAFRKTMFWKAKLTKVGEEMEQLYEGNHRLRKEVYNPYAIQLKQMQRELDRKVDECLDFRALPLSDILAKTNVVPEAYPPVGDPEEDIIRGLAGEHYIKAPVKIGNHTPLEDIYYIGFALQTQHPANLDRGSALVPWMSGSLKRTTDNVTIANANTPEELVAHALKPAPLSPIPAMKWKRIGQLCDFVLEDVMKQYSKEEFEFGATFNTRNILPCTVNGWNGTTLIASVTTPHLQGDDGGNMWFGSSICTRGTQDELSKNNKKNGCLEFTHAYVSQMDDGSFGYNKRSWQTLRWLTLFVRPLPLPWKPAGEIETMKDYEKLMKKYPFDEYEWGNDYNGGSIRALSITTWNRGIRIHTQVPYPQGDDATKIKYGVACWTCGTDDEESKHRFFHRYLSLKSPMPRELWSNGYGLKVFVRCLGNTW